MEGKAAAFGNHDFVMPYSTLGLETFAVDPSDREGIATTAERIVKEKYALVVVAENIAPAAEEFFGPTQTQAIPCVLVVPFTQESTGYATDALGKLIKLATGINILADA